MDEEQKNLNRKIETQTKEMEYKNVVNAYPLHHDQETAENKNKVNKIQKIILKFRSFEFIFKVFINFWQI